MSSWIESANSPIGNPRLRAPCMRLPGSTWSYMPLMSSKAVPTLRPRAAWASAVAKRTRAA
eukprot:10805454-Lingulodinium_polyedra.AAC.1